jgi:folate-binding Fe-S cluster repair protein YgfZ
MAIEHEQLGARMAELAGRRVPRHYGDPAAEYAAATTSAVVVDRADRVVLRVGGRDPVRMLHGLVTNDLAGAGAGAAVYGAFLTPKGRMVAEARLLRRGDAVLVETAAAAEDALRAHFRKYLPPLFARAEEQPVGAVLGIYGPRADAVIAGADAQDAIRLGALDVAEGMDLLVAPDELEPLWARLVAAGARPAGRAGAPSWTRA